MWQSVLKQPLIVVIRVNPPPSLWQSELKSLPIVAIRVKIPLIVAIRVKTTPFVVKYPRRGYDYIANNPYLCKT